MDFTTANLNDDNLDEMKAENIPDVVSFNCVLTVLSFWYPIKDLYEY